MAKIDGKLYGAKALTMVVIAFLFVVMPWMTAGAINVAYNYGDKTTLAYPDSPTNFSHGVTWHTFENGSYGASDCEPYDHLTSTSGQYPASPYQLQSEQYAILHPQPAGAIAGSGYENITWRNIGSPFAPHHAGAASCRTVNDVLGIRLDPATALAYSGIGKTMIRFNATLVQFHISPDVFTLFNITEAEFDWWVEIDGVEMFGEEVRFGDEDSDIRPLLYINNSGSPITAFGYKPTIQFDHTLNPIEERKVRDALATANLSNLNVSLFWHCLDAGQGFEPCSMQEYAGSTAGWDWYIHAETEWIYADDYDLIIQGTAFVLSIVSLLIAVASTPLWNPLASRLKGDV